MILELSEDEETNEVSQLKRERDLHLTLPKPVERSQVTYELSDLLKIRYTFFYILPIGLMPYSGGSSNRMPCHSLPENFFLSPFLLLLAKECSRPQATLSLFQE